MSGPFEVSAARAAGFVDVPYDLSDRPVRGLFYLYRVHDGQHQYLSLMYDDAFLEAVLEVFYAPRNHKAKKAGKESEQQKKGALRLYANIYREWKTLEEAFGRTYALATDKP